MLEIYICKFVYDLKSIFMNRNEKTKLVNEFKIHLILHQELHQYHGYKIQYHEVFACQAYFFHQK